MQNPFGDEANPLLVEDAELLGSAAAAEDPHAFDFGGSERRRARARRRRLFLGLVGTAVVVGVASAVVVGHGETSQGSSSPSSSSPSSSSTSSSRATTNRMHTSSNVPGWHHVSAGSSGDGGPASITGFGFGADDDVPFKLRLHSSEQLSVSPSSAPGLSWAVKSSAYDDMELE